MDQELWELEFLGFLEVGLIGGEVILVFHPAGTVNSTGLALRNKNSFEREKHDSHITYHSGISIS